MALKKKPVTGMKDILPAEMQIRDYVLNQIKETYRGFGFSAIETPCVEHIENLLSKQGGDNEKLMKYSCSGPTEGVTFFDVVFPNNLRSLSA